MDTPLWDAVASFVEEIEPGAQAVPLIVPGFTDSHWVREAFGTVAYGFFPMRAMDAETAARLIHSADERVPVDDLELGVRFLRHAAVAMSENG
jgi:acetylornithine deacetylase/succinyl-diaminopimelate desuccinylase-like protein